MSEIEVINSVKVRLVSMYGKTLYYPECILSEWLCSITSRKSLSQDNINFLKKHFDVEIEE